MKKNKILTFSYDDGVTQDIRLIELFNKYHMKATFNLNSDLLGKQNELVRDGVRVSHNKIKPEDVRYIYEGHEIAVHTLTHPLLTQLSGSFIRGLFPKSPSFLLPVFLWIKKEKKGK